MWEGNHKHKHTLNCININLRYSVILCNVSYFPVIIVVNIHTFLIAYVSYDKQQERNHSADACQFHQS